MMQATQRSPGRFDGTNSVLGSPSAAPATDNTGQVWWRHPMVWLVIAGPVLVVIAGFWTLWLAISHPDPVVTGSTVRMEAGSDANTLAQTARNHAATSRAKP